MFKLIESLNKGFIRFQIVGSDISIGHIVQTKEISGDLFVEKSDGSRPFGFVGDIEDNWAKIYSSRMICRTSKFDKNLIYKGGDFLYVNDGILTNIKTNISHYSVGNLITDFRPKYNYIELNWL